MSQKISEASFAQLRMVHLAGLLVVFAVLLYVVAALLESWVSEDIQTIWAPRILAAAQQPAADHAQLHRELAYAVGGARLRESLIGALVHIAVALLVAAILLVLVELRVRELSRIEFESFMKQIAAVGAWGAISGRKLPESILAQVQSVLELDTIRVDGSYHLTILPPPTLRGIDSSSMVLVKRRTTYKLRKVATVEQVVHSLLSSFSGSVQLTGTSGTRYPRYTYLSIAGKQSSPGDHTAISQEVVVGNDDVQVAMESEELYDRTDCIYYMMGSPITKFTLDVVVGARQIIICDVRLTTSSPGPVAALVSTGNKLDGGWEAGGRWEYGGALLPGQGFLVAWRDIETSPVPLTPHSA
jgi:hypothetical protein